MIHTFIDKGSEKTLVLFHGTGGDETVLLALAERVAPTMNHLSLRGNVVAFGKRRFCSVQDASQIIDEADMLRRVPELLQVIENFRNKYELGTLWTLGFSNGANTIAAMLLEAKTPFEKAILLRPMNFSSSTNEMDLNGMDILIHSGRFDDVIPYESAIQLEHRLIDNNAHVTHRIYDLDHKMRSYEIDEIASWFKEALQ